MKIKSTRMLAMLLALFLLFSCSACKPQDPALDPQETQGEGSLPPIWNSAIYKEDATVGNGSKTVTVDVEAKGHTVILTVKTDAATLGEALYALGLVNDPSFFDTANGIKADWNADSAYWAYFEGDSYMNVGINDTQILGGEYYRLVYTQ